ncbi:hypothetical protein [Streptomyces mobaraensis]|uniref:Uncharacterized protein n=1 Tax=Streptomyces mobaraensis TaxID=35621 RepID=A0A5N5WCW8_STRMB|nr:hypothetical protein [Streptomyces mobaraensis]KAB7850186.1 hypothetical protein FRZ00_06200 [Streptomyces mobaraensis]
MTTFPPFASAPAPAGAGPAPRVFTVTLPAGLPLLNANQRPHYRRRAEITKRLRGAAMEAVSEHRALMVALAASSPEPLFQRAHVLGILHPSTRGRRDPANWYPSFKAAIDGLVDAGVLEDDDHTRLLGPDMRLGSLVKGGQLALCVRELGSGEGWIDLGSGATG